MWWRQWSRLRRCEVIVCNYSNLSFIQSKVVETEAITLATADGQIVRVISKEQYERLLAVASKNKTYKCDTCNRRFTNTNAFQNHYNLR